MATRKKATSCTPQVTRKATTQGTRKAGAGKVPGLTTEERNRLPESAFAFPNQRKEPLTDAKHVRNAVARFDQVEGATDTERAEAWDRIVRAAARLDVQLSEGSWQELMDKGSSKRRWTNKA